MKEQLNIILNKCQSIDEVIQLIKNGTPIGFSKSEIAAQYIFNCMQDCQDFSDTTLEGFYNSLIDEGAELDFEDVRFDIRQLEHPEEI